MSKSKPKYEGYTQMLDGRDIPSLAKYIKSDVCKNVVVMLGAGVSTSAGIPDFRSPKTGLYANLARLKLPYPEAVFEINYFRSNPYPFYTLAKELFPGRYRPTITHSFVRLLATRSLLKKCFTQNIDTLERIAGVPSELIIEAHGSFASQHCIDCRLPYDGDTLKDHILSGTVAYCEKCEGLVKPDIVFFGEQLPPEFHRSVPLLRNADLLIVMGTSLMVQPFASLATMVPEFCPRVLVNLDAVGNFGSRADDVLLLGKTDDVVRKLAQELGWEEELDALWKETESVIAKPLTSQPKQQAEKKADNKPQTKKTATETVAEAKASPEASVEEEVDKLTAKVESALTVSGVPPESDRKDKQEVEETVTKDATTVAKDEKDAPPAKET